MHSTTMPPKRRHVVSGNVPCNINHHILSHQNFQKHEKNGQFHSTSSS